MRAIEVLATILTIVGFFLLSEKVYIVGFTISLFSNMLWLLWGYEKKAWGIIVVNACLAVSSINGII